MSKDIVDVKVEDGKLIMDVHCPGDPGGKRCQAKMALFKVLAGKMGFRVDTEEEGGSRRPEAQVEEVHVKKRQKT
ncbi:hypothetical protein HN858_05640 [Candidatus Falkowbacteria bacterium]|jgi:hypothetical protein|nr:hypothetical protein [Candidatus Falkowbacteria bacterium]MBT5502893.1 hypothetical protein [Candidatus Falkowbacteria bacterium]MBT6573743.1 hypothetical protein [Candidatus Falkowbacteria bacterium]MBT7349119.1 hypothetical protein [Candidatus Falkowbacteria bacterium]MBT7500071.1 hypothetical protein [Candidatus Falkowbacteria bacterium]